MIDDIKFTPSESNKIRLHFQCSNNMTLEDIYSDIKEYIFEHKNELYLDRTALPIYLKRYTLIRDDTLWDK